MENMKRVVSLMLCIVMVFGLLPMTVFATDVDTTDEVFEEYFEEEIEVEAPAIENEEPVTPEIPDVPETFDSEEEIEIIEVIEEVADLGDANPVAPIADGNISDQITIVEYTNQFNKVTTPKSGKRYIIANTGSTGNGYALTAGTTSGTSVKVESTGSGANTTYFIENNDQNIIWTAASGLTFQSAADDTYLSANSSNALSFVESGAKNWAYSSNRLSYSSGSRYNYYLRYNSGWSVSSSSSNSNVYFYEQVRTRLAYKVDVANTDITMVENGTAQIEAVLFENNKEIAGLTYQVLEGSVTVSNTGLITAGTAGTARILVSYTVNGKTVGEYVDVTVIEPGYYLDITKDNEVVTKVIAVKGVKANDQMALGLQVTEAHANGTIEILSNLPSGASVKWDIPAEYQNIATVDQNGVVTFNGVSGKFYVQVSMTTADGKSLSKTVDISVSASDYSVPSDGATDFPEYPNEGAIRYDKTASAVGSFSQTGIAKMELSMTGVPYITGAEIDVVIMLDQSTSMNDDRIEATQAATELFINSIVKNTDGSYNGNRVYVGYFNGTTIYDITDADNIGGKLASVDNEVELEFLIDDLYDQFDGSPTTSGTHYDEALAASYTILNNAKSDGIGDNRQQFMVFMSDGEPTHFSVNANTTSSSSGMFTNGNRNSNYKYEYYSTQMKKDNVTVYSVGLGLSKGTAEILLNDISGPAGETTQPDALNTSTQSKKGKYFFSVEDADAASEMSTVFSGIAQAILQAATDVTVEDEITDEYTMIFDVPTGKHGIDVGGQEFYIEFLKYTLDENNERIADSAASLSKMYLKNTGNQYSAVNEDGTAYAAPVFTQNPVGDKGTLYYWTTDASEGDTGVSYTTGGKTYYFVSSGLKAGANNYNMTAGGFASGSVNTTTNMSENLVLATPYFVYNANTKMLYWTVDKLDNYEYVLNYFLYLDNSATQVGEADEKEAGTYPTNKYAYITYTNFLQHGCRQEFPKPQMTWNGAQASYVFYLVNAQGQPINKSGQVVDFANATFVTDVFTESIIWNKGTGSTSTGKADLDVDWLAEEKLPEGYTLYDTEAKYTLDVWEKADGSSLKNQFTIAGSEANGNTGSTTKVYNTKAGTKYSAYGTYVSTNNPGENEIALPNFDFANTTVAFAVVWEGKLNPDVVVVDFGLDVLIDVTSNDMLQNTVYGFGWNNLYDDVTMNTGITSGSRFDTRTKANANGDTISYENENQIRFSQGDMIFNEPVTFYYESAVNFYEQSAPKSGYMYSSVTVIPATTIYYEDDFVTLKSYTWDDNNNGWTEVPEEETPYVWAQLGETIDATQAQDRPGAANISGTLDADNIYGYDQAYDECTQYSMGSAKIATVNYDNYGTASFTFYGTGFDVVSLTSGDTGMITVDVVDASGTSVKKTAVDTYYGYQYVLCDVIYTYDARVNNNKGAWIQTAIYANSDTYKASEPSKEPKHGDTYVVERMDYIVNPNASDTLYQVPVIKVDGLTYGQYTVTIEAAYEPGFDHKKPSYDDGEYLFILDAIRIYDPTGNLNDTANNAYEKDGELKPSYQEIRNNLIEAGSFDISNSEKVNGFMYIDGQSGDVKMANYMNYGPNNEVYLKQGQSIAFKIDAPNKTKSGLKIKNVHFGAKSADGSKVEYSVMNICDDEIVNQQTFTLETSTDMYYDLTEWAAEVIVITNNSKSVLSLTNLKYTYETVVQTAEVVEEVVEAYAYMTAADAEMVLRVLNTPVVEETEPEVTEPETEATEPETEPETTKPGSDSGSTGSVVKKIIGIIGKLLGKIFG